MAELSPCDRGCLACRSWNSHHLALPRKVSADSWFAWCIPASMSMSVLEFQGTWESLQVGGSYEEESEMRDMWSLKEEWNGEWYLYGSSLDCYVQTSVCMCRHVFVYVCIYVYLCLCMCLFMTGWRLWAKSAYFSNNVPCNLLAGDVMGVTLYKWVG